MPESGTPLERAETKVHKAQAVLGEVDQVLQTNSRRQRRAGWDTTPPSTRAAQPAGLVYVVFFKVLQSGEYWNALCSAPFGFSRLPACRYRVG